jgi:hypothetical protein
MSIFAQPKLTQSKTKPVIARLKQEQEQKQEQGPKAK